MESVNVSEEASFASQLSLAVGQDEENNQRNWYVGLFLDENDDGLVRADHLQPIAEGDDFNWKQPRLDIQDVDPVQIVPCAIRGEWDISRNVVFVVTNSQDINETYEQFHQSNLMH